MLSLTKIFNFEMAHALFGYVGACSNIHGHSYKLYITVSIPNPVNEYIAPPGFIIDFKEIKKIVFETIISKFDHSIVLSKDYLKANRPLNEIINLIVFDAEPSAENLLIYFKNKLQEQLPLNVLLSSIRLYETKDSYVEWNQTHLKRNKLKKHGLHKL